MSEATRRPPANKPLILLVEDYDDAREMYAEFLELSGFRVAEARDGAQSIEKALELHPDVILMDLSLPRMDGRQAIQHLKSDERTKNIPVVVLSGLNERDLGVSDAPPWDSFLTKPCPPEALLEQVHRALSALRRAGSSGF